MDGSRMGKPLSDEEVGLTSGGDKPLSDADVGITPTEQPRTVFGELGKNLPAKLLNPFDLSGATMQDALGLAEQPGASLYSMFNQAQAGVRAFGRAAIAKTAGLNFGDIFNEEYQQKLNDMPDYVPLTPRGAELSAKLSTIMEDALKAYGDAAYTLGRPPGLLPQDWAEVLGRRATGSSADSPLAGAAGEALMTGASFLLPVAKGKTNLARAADPIKTFEAEYPQTNAAINASQVGKIRFDNKYVLDAVDEGLNKELGPGVEYVPLDMKLKAVIIKYAPDLPASQATAVANAYATRFKAAAQAQQDLIKATPKLPAPGQLSKDAITVDSQGIATTPTTRIVKDYAMQKNWDAYNKWAEERDATLSGKPTGIKVKPGQEGAFDVDGLQFVVPEGIKSLKDATAKGVVANYALTPQEKNWFKNMDYVTWEDLTNHVPSAKFQGDSINVAAQDIPRLKEILDYVNSPQNVDPTGGIRQAGIEGMPTKRVSDLKKQSGAFDVEGLDQNAPKAIEVAKQAAGKSWTLSNPEDAAKAAQRALDQTYKTADEKNKLISMNTVKKARRALVAHDFDLQSDLSKAGPAGEKAMLEMNVQHNATTMAKTRYDATGRQIFDNVSGEDLKNLEKIVRLRRIVQTDLYKGVGKVIHEVDPVTKKPLTGPIADAALADMEKSIPNFKDLDSKATAIFNEERKNLHRLLEEGLITQKDFEKSMHADYTLPEYMNLIDPRVKIESRGIAQEMRASGIEERASSGMDAKLALQESIARVENRIARNNTYKALRQLALENPGNGIVEVAGKDPAPKGYTKFQVKIDGENKYIQLHDEFADQLQTRNDILPSTVANVIRAVSGSAILRAAATTYNPTFILAGLPMDLMHLWLATSKEYSTFLPKYAMQIVADLGATAKDAFFRTGRWEQAMLEGLGPNFLTHESRAGSMNIKQMDPFLRRTRTALAFLGDFQDMWVRLAHRERLIKQGIDAKTATALAVQRLNYSRGGVVTKFIDTFIPYTNVAVNSLSRVAETAAKDPKGSFAKVAQLSGVLAATKLANMLMSPETDQAIPVEDKIRNVQVTFGDQYYVMDPDGNKRYLYVNIRLDQTAMPFNAAVVAGLENAEYGKVPDGALTKAIGQVNPLSSMFPPTWQAYRSYTDNYDPLRDGPIYHGLRVKPEDEIRNVSRGQPTSALAQFVGQTAGLSPMGLEKAAGQLVNMNNLYIQAAGGALKLMFAGMNPREQAEDTVQYMLETVPGLRSVVKLTTPGIQMMKDLEKTDRESNSLYKRQIDGLEEKLFQVTQKQAGMKEVEAYIKEQPVEAQKTLVDHAKYVYKVDQILKNAKASEGIPPRNWWISSARIKDEARAQVFYNEWISRDAEERRRMMGVANQLQAAGTGYMSQGFQREYTKQIQMLGTEKR